MSNFSQFLRSERREYFQRSAPRGFHCTMTGRNQLVLSVLITNIFIIYSNQELTPNRCLLNNQFELLSSGSDLTVHENTNFISLLKNILNIRNNIQPFHYERILDYACTDNALVCLASQPANIALADLTISNRTLILNAFLILNNKGGYCVIATKFYTLTNCKTALTEIANVKDKIVDTFPTYTARHSKFDPLNIGYKNTQTFILVYKDGQYSFTNTFAGSTCCVDTTISQRFYLQQNLYQNIQNLVCNILNFLKPIISSKIPTSDTATIISNNSAFQDRWSRISEHFPRLYQALSGDINIGFPNIIYDRHTTQSNINEKMTEYLTLMEIFQSCQTRNRRGLLEYLVSGDSIQSLTRNEKHLIDNAEISQQNFKLINKFQHSLSSAQKQLDFQSKTMLGKLNHLKENIDLIGSEILISNTHHNNVLNNYQSIQSLNLVNLMVENSVRHLNSYIERLINPGTKCYKTSDDRVFICNIIEVYYSFGLDLHATIIGQKSEITQTTRFSCLSLDDNLIFTANNKHFVFSNNTYTSLDNSTHFHSQCLTSVPLCPEMYKNATFNLLQNKCNIAHNNLDLYLNCEIKQKIVLASGGSILINSVPTKLIKSNFPIQIGQDSFYLNEIFSNAEIFLNENIVKYKDSSLHLTPFQEIQLPQPQPNNSTLEADFRDLFTAKDFEIAHVLGISTLSLTALIIIIITIVCCCKYQCCRNVGTFIISKICLCVCGWNPFAPNPPPGNPPTSNNPPDNPPSANVNTHRSPPPPPPGGSQSAIIPVSDISNARRVLANNIDRLNSSLSRFAFQPSLVSSRSSCSLCSI